MSSTMNEGDVAAAAESALRELVAALPQAQGFDIAPDAMRACAAYTAAVLDWGQRMDLTAPRDVRGTTELLFADALVIAASGWVPPSARVVDVGAGAGAPTIPLALLRPDIHITLAEPRLKRSTFLRWCVTHLHLDERANVLQQRVEPKKPQLPGAPFDVALSRATLPADAWLEVGAKLAARTLVLTAKAPVAIRTDGLHELDGPIAYTLPFSGAPRHLQCFEVKKEPHATHR